MIAQFFNLWNRSTWYRIYILVLLLAFIKQCFHFSAPVDWNEYCNAARNLISHFNLDSCDPDGRSCEHLLHKTRRTAGYPVLIALLFFQKYLLVLLQLIAAFIMPLIGDKILKTMAPGKQVVHFFLAFCLLFPLQIFYSVLPMPEILCQLLILWAWLLLLQKKYFWLGLNITFLLLLKPVFIILVFAAAIYSLFYFKQRFVLLLPLIVWLIISALNYNQTGVWHYASIGIENRMEYNAAAVMNRVMSQDEITEYYNIHSSHLVHDNFKDRFNFLDQESKRIITSHWKLYLWLHAKGSLLAFVDPGRYDLIVFFDLKEGSGFMQAKSGGGMMNSLKSQPAWMLVYLTLFALVNGLRWLFFFNAWYRMKRQMLLPVLLVLFFIAVTGPVGSARYILPFIPVISLIAALGMPKQILPREKNISGQR